ncbi:MAG: hypothetical protein ACE5G5_06205 [Candidatus Methylomirabilales bacterium]
MRSARRITRDAAVEKGKGVLGGDVRLTTWPAESPYGLGSKFR